MGYLVVIRAWMVVFLLYPVRRLNEVREYLKRYCFHIAMMINK
jgi:hypothetical protein